MPITGRKRSSNNEETARGLHRRLVSVADMTGADDGDSSSVIVGSAPVDARSASSTISEVK